MNGLSFIRKRYNLRQGQLAEKLVSLSIYEKTSRNRCPWLESSNAAVFWNWSQNCLTRLPKSKWTLFSIVPVLCT